MDWTASKRAASRASGTKFGRPRKVDDSGYIATAKRMKADGHTGKAIYHHKRESIDAHLTIVFAALAVSHYIEHQTGGSIKKFVRTTRRYRTVKIKARRQTLTAADPLPDDLRDAPAKISSAGDH